MLASAKATCNLLRIINLGSIVVASILLEREMQIERKIFNSSNSSTIAALIFKICSKCISKVASFLSSGLNASENIYFNFE